MSVLYALYLITVFKLANVSKLYNSITTSRVKLLLYGLIQLQVISLFLWRMCAMCLRLSNTNILQTFNIAFITKS